MTKTYTKAYHVKLFVTFEITRRYLHRVILQFSFQGQPKILDKAQTKWAKELAGWEAQPVNLFI